jgi:hypothetical protein
MPRYYFDFFGSNKEERDRDGTQLRDESDAVKEASLVLLELLRDNLEQDDSTEVRATIRIEGGDIFVKILASICAQRV